MPTHHAIKIRLKEFMILSKEVGRIEYEYTSVKDDCGPEILHRLGTARTAMNNSFNALLELLTTTDNTQ
jgi:hypothetical protein